MYQLDEKAQHMLSLFLFAHPQPLQRTPNTLLCHAALS
jgi:hypothetical protein